MLYLAPWVDLGGSDKGTIDWFRSIDRTRWAPSLITTQPSLNRWIPDLAPYADEIWTLPELMAGAEFVPFILGFIESRGVQILHVMNARIGFDLLVDIQSLPDPPATVVQLHAEEADRSGYVQYVANRYDAIVDAYSLVSQHLADSMRDYEVGAEKLRVLHLGVDATGEFDPAQVAPYEERRSVPRILWPGRLVAQKDPLLTVDVVAELVRRGVAFELTIVGDGDLAEDTRRRADELGVADRFAWHPPSKEMPRWYRSSDVLLMTSVFEGIPLALYEALAMGVPAVVPALPGNVELLDGGGGALIEPRDDVAAYADALERLLTDDDHRAEVGALARRRMLDGFTVEAMGRAHDALYEELLERRAAAPAAPPREEWETDETAIERQAAELGVRPTLRLPREREDDPDRSVLVVVPCFRHGQYLEDALASVRRQTLPAARVVVVDDASDDAETIAALERVERAGWATVLRQPERGGPSAARNRALEGATERYVLPLDADDELFPWTLESMVAQIERAPENVGFVYPNAQHFGHRNDAYEPPAYNLHVLLDNNYCAATSLFDRRVFAAGIGYAEELTHGHEDWDLILTLAEHGVIGERALEPSFRYRKKGFSRVSGVNHAQLSPAETMARRHPRLYGRRDAIKAAWAPALSVILQDGPDGDAWASRCVADLQRQGLRDFEVIATIDGPADGSVCWNRVRPEQLVEDAGIRTARGRFVVMLDPRAADALAQPSLLEQITRTAWMPDQESRFVLTTAIGRGGPLTCVTPDDLDRATPVGVAWRRDPEIPPAIEALDEEYDKIGLAPVRLRPGRPAIEQIAEQWAQEGVVRWRTVA